MAILEPEILGNRNINFNWILISLQWFLIVELYRYLCYGCLKFPARVYKYNTISIIDDSKLE